MAEKSRIEALREKKEKIAEQIKKALVVENTKKRKLEKREKILLGVMFQGLIAEGAISSQMFEGAMEKYLKNEKEQECCDAYFEQHRFQASEVESTEAGLTDDDQTLSVETDFETTTPLDEGSTGTDIEPI